MCGPVAIGVYYWCLRIDAITCFPFWPVPGVDPTCTGYLIYFCDTMG